LERSKDMAYEAAINKSQAATNLLMADEDEVALLQVCIVGAVVGAIQLGQLANRRFAVG
jgi:hypothetical protein